MIPLSAVNDMTPHLEAGPKLADLVSAVLKQLAVCLSRAWTLLRLHGLTAGQLQGHHSTAFAAGLAGRYGWWSQSALPARCMHTLYTFTTGNCDCFCSTAFNVMKAACMANINVHRHPFSIRCGRDGGRQCMGSNRA